MVFYASQYALMWRVKVEISNTESSFLHRFTSTEPCNISTKMATVLSSEPFAVMQDVIATQVHK